MKISVAMCTWNGEKYLAEQLTSILSQTSQVQEIIICDDQSSDNTVEIINSFQEMYPGIIMLVQNEKTLQARKNFEKAIGLTSGDFIFLCDQDDCWLPDKVQVNIDFFKANPDALGVFSNGYFLEEKGINYEKTLWDAISFSEKLQHEVNPHNMLEMLLRINNFVTGAALCITQKAKDYIFPFDCPAPHYWHDYWIALQLAQRNQLYLLNEKLINYRIHSLQQTGFSAMARSEHQARVQLKESVWKDDYSETPPYAALGFLISANQRLKYYRTHLNFLPQNKERIEHFSDSLTKSIKEVKAIYISKAGFFQRKKIFLLSVIRKKKFYFFSFKDKVQLLFT